MSEDKEEFENWAIPQISEDNQDTIEDNTLFGKPATWYNNQDKNAEEVDVEEEPQPLTLEDIEAIRLSAYEDGFNEGKEAGLEKGLEEGKLEGIANGYKEGLEQGLKEGLEEGAGKIEEQASEWQGLIERLHAPLEKLDENTEYQLIRLATTLAKQITRCEVKTDPKIILQALKLAVNALPISEQKLIINLHPEDLLFVQNAYTEAQCLQRGWDLQAEPALMRGDCQIKTQVSSVDFAFSTRIEQVLKSFFKENHEKLPNKNDDSNLINETPMVAKSSPSSEEMNTTDAAVEVTEEINEEINE